MSCGLIVSTRDFSIEFPGGYTGFQLDNGLLFMLFHRHSNDKVKGRWHPGFYGRNIGPYSPLLQNRPGFAGVPALLPADMLADPVSNFLDASSSLSATSNGVNSPACFPRVTKSPIEITPLVGHIVIMGKGVYIFKSDDIKTAFGQNSASFCRKCILSTHAITSAVAFQVSYIFFLHQLRGNVQLSCQYNTIPADRGYNLPCPIS